MVLSVVTFTHRTAPLEIRERLGFSLDEQIALLRRWKPAVSEAALLVTCHRTELYLIEDECEAERGLLWLAQATQLPVDDLRRVAVTARDQHAARHLMRVAAGLDSVVVGETQILGQVRRAREIARAAGTLGPRLERLFSLSLAAGRAARTHAGLMASGRSLARLAVQMAGAVLGGWEGRTALVLGLGEMGRLVVAELRRERPAVVWVSNRTPERLHALTAEEGIRPVEWTRSLELVNDVEAIFVATAAPRPILDASHFDVSTRWRVVVDLAVPRNVDAAVEQVPGIRLVTIDDLRDEEGGQDSAAFEHRAKQVVDRYVDRYLRWWQAQRLAEEIRSVQGVIEAVCYRELRRAMRSISRDPERLTVIERQAAASVARKVLAPILRAIPHDPDLVGKALRLLGTERPPSHLNR